MAGPPEMAATRSASSAPSRPPSVPAPAICPNRRFAVRGSKRSVTISQNPDASSGPDPEMCKYTSTAVATDRISHSPTNSRPLTTKQAGTSSSGERRRVRRVWAATSKIEHTDVAISIIGNDLTSTEVRNNASRVALPPTNPAVKVAAQSIVVVIDRDEVVAICGTLPFVVGSAHPIPVCC